VLKLDFLDYLSTFTSSSPRHVRLEALARAGIISRPIPGATFFLASYAGSCEILMLELPQIREMLKQIATGVLPARELLEIRTEPSVDAEGRETLRITLVLTEDAANTFTGEQASRLILDLRDGLLNKGDERFPVLYYATPDDSGDLDRDDDDAD
jgi:hypothetical protein